MITPKDIENKGFDKALRGYKIEQVDEFLDQIIIDMEFYINENEALKEELAEIKEDIAKQKKSEKSIVNTLESAKKLMQDISESAERRAELVMKNAKMDAETIIRDANESVKKLNSDTENVQRQAKQFRNRYRSMLEEELKKLEESEEKVFAGLEEIKVQEESLPDISERNEMAGKPGKDYEPIDIEDLFGDDYLEVPKQDDTKIAIDKKTWSDTVVPNGLKVSPRKTVALDSSDIERMLKTEGIDVNEKSKEE